MRGGSFTARLESFWGESQAGDAAARAALAAAETCDGKNLQSLHAVFLEPMPPDLPLDLEVTSLHDGNRSSTRHVTIHLRGRLLGSVTLSFGPATGGLSYQGAIPDDGLPSPEELSSTVTRAESEGWAPFASGPVEFRRIGRSWPWPPASPMESSIHREWVSPRERLPEAPRVEMAAMVFLSGFYSHWMASDRLGSSFRPDRFRLREHALWVHRPARWEGWWLLKAITEVGHAGRMFSRRELYTREGTLVASCAQEGFYSSEGP